MYTPHRRPTDNKLDALRKIVEKGAKTLFSYLRFRVTNTAAPVVSDSRLCHLVMIAIVSSRRLRMLSRSDVAVKLDKVVPITADYPNSGTQTHFGIG